ncbi:hypothetical protein [uncultured Psychrobacter sp.]|uniref:hypothetical protein n=1 Tax=uncultured Psychrobacter sp. TaxID=259303 RepID=UPI0030D7D351
MSKKQGVNCIFAVRFDDANDPRYQAITDIMMGGDMWTNGNLVYAAHLDSRDELCAQIEKLEYKDDE